MRWIEDFLSLIYPNNCLSCARHLTQGERYMCMFCLNDLPTQLNLDGRNNPSFRSFLGRMEIERAFSWLKFEKGNKTQRILHQLKYKGQSEIGLYFGRIMGEELIKTPGFDRFDAIVPVPIHRSKKKIRTYNQSDFIARGLNEVYQTACLEKAVVRTVNSESQTRKKRYERWENVRNVFEIKASKPEKVHHVLLVDDVLTTGATIEACGHCIQKAWNVKLSIATLARSG